MYRGQKSAAPGFPSAAMPSHAASIVALRALSPAVRLQFPPGRGMSSVPPNTKGISAVCVAPSSDSAPAGMVGYHGHVGVWLKLWWSCVDSGQHCPFDK